MDVNKNHLVILQSQALFTVNLMIITCSGHLFLTPENCFAQSKGASVIPYANNPASAAFLEKDSAAFAISPFSINDVKVRYVGSETISKKEGTPLSFTDFQLGTAWKASKKFSLGIGEILPPVSVKKSINDIPVVILNSVNLVDLGINAHVKYGFAFFASYLANERLSLGVGLSAREINVAAVAKTATGEKLLNGDFKIATSDLTFGTNYIAIPNRLRLGLAASLVSSNEIGTKIQTPLVAQENSASLSKTSRTNQILGNVIFGAEITPNQVMTWYSDLIWKRSDPGQKEFSLVDIIEKKKDIHDTVSVAVGSRYRTRETEFVSAGFSYEPSAVGAGTKGETGTSGFGMRETVLLYSGFGDLFPAWTIAIGLQYGANLPATSDQNPQEKSHALKNNKKSTNTPHAKPSLRDRLTYSFGMKYRRASLGIDQNGELPGAYSQTKISFPFSILARF